MVGPPCSALLRAGLAGLLCGALFPAWGQEPKAEPSAATNCLSPPAAQRGAPDYPFEEWKLKKPGRVKVALDFAGPDLRPAVTVLEREGSSEFVDAVKDHVRTLRVPCLSSVDIPTRLVFDYVFKPDTRQALYDTPNDAADPERQAMLACMAHQSGTKAPPYPTRVPREARRGRVLLQMRFTAPDQSPSFSAFASQDSDPLKQAIEDWAKGYRMPCQQGSAVNASITFIFAVADDPPYGFKDITFYQFLRNVKGLEEQALIADTTTMGCPFELELQYRQPLLPNTVGQIGSIDPARRPLMEWLAQAELNLTRQVHNIVFADDVRFVVPCVKLDLKAPAAKPASEPPKKE